MGRKRFKHLEIVGLDNDGNVVQWDDKKKEMYNTGETPEDYGLNLMNEVELARCRVAQQEIANRTPIMVEINNAHPDMFPLAREWIKEGWGLEGPISAEQYAAAWLMEARTQDECVKAGDSDESWPKLLRECAFKLLKGMHPNN